LQAAKENDDFRGKNSEQSQKLSSEVAEQLESALTHTKVRFLKRNMFLRIVIIWLCLFVSG
jgi:hypothetical protein